MTIAEICTVIPEGVVVFFPSYDYLNLVFKIWNKPLENVNGLSVLSRIARAKTVIHEPQGKSMNIEDLLRQYSHILDQGKGALLLSVMGGKLSEGINFSDSLGRGVVVVGLPFPNMRSTVWQAKLEYVERRAYEQCLGVEETRKARSTAAGREYYENCCMRTVNQCIGRAIRHRNDYAAIVMIDRRYNTPRIQSKLPTWIRQSLPSDIRPVENTLHDLALFFDRKRAKDAVEKSCAR
jgi:chromosome transmission fidelity protein 1